MHNIVQTVSMKVICKFCDIERQAPKNTLRHNLSKSQANVGDGLRSPDTSGFSIRYLEPILIILIG